MHQTRSADSFPFPTLQPAVRSACIPASYASEVGPTTCPAREFMLVAYTGCSTATAGGLADAGFTPTRKFSMHLEAGTSSLRQLTTDCRAGSSFLAIWPNISIGGFPPQIPQAKLAQHAGAADCRLPRVGFSSVAETPETAPARQSEGGWPAECGAGACCRAFCWRFAPSCAHADKCPPIKRRSARTSCSSPCR